ncbi:MAG: YggS family pyridoxal phosphate-dependent enzyme [Gammaproteobacteria bacterium]
MNDLAANISAVRRRIAAAADACGRAPSGVNLLGVTKTQSPSLVAAAYRAGLRTFGTNYLQEGLAHMDAAPDAEWHFIGRVQSNKTRAIAERFSWVQTLDNSHIARRLSIQRPVALGALNVCIQLNVDGEASKAGVPPEAALALADEIASLAGLRLRGVMAIPRPVDDPEAQRRAFAGIRRVFDALAARHPGIDTLSMGMSADLESAICEGATLVRIGTALFGARN